jgi:hypothetical protein
MQLIIKSKTYLDACTVKGYIGDHYPEITNSNIIIYPDNHHYVIKIELKDNSDIHSRLENSRKYLTQENKCFPW